MKLPDANDVESVEEHIRKQAESEQLRVTAHFPLAETVEPVHIENSESENG
jgi:hypothetical protein